MAVFFSSMPTRFFKSFLFIFVFLFSHFFFLVPRVQAVGISPILVDIEKAPGENYFGKIRITNENNAETIYYLSVQNFVAKGEDGQQAFIPEDNSFGLAKWIIPEAKSIQIGPYGSKNISYSVVIPKKADPGGHYAALFVSTKPETEDSGSSVGVGAKTGVLFLARVAGDIRESAKVESFRIKNSGILNRLPAFFEVRIQNSGNVHLRPQGDIDIVNMFGHTVDRIPLNSLNGAVLPESIRRFEPTWAHTMVPAEGNWFTRELKNEWNNFAIGKYTATVHATYGRTNQPLTAEIQFWIIPWRIMLVAVLIFILLLLFIRGYNRLVVRAALKKRRS